MLPSLPNELTSEILKQATHDLVEQERHDSTLTGHTNALLLSASLVSRTWRSIAHPLLLRHGIVDPSKAELFIAELERVGFKDSLGAVQIGVPASSSTTQLSDDEARASGAGLRAILKALPELRSLAFVGQRLRFLECRRMPNRVNGSFRPVDLSVIDDLDPDVPWSDGSNVSDGGDSLSEIYRIIRSSKNLSLITNSWRMTVFILAFSSTLLNALDSFRLEFRDGRNLKLICDDLRGRATSRLENLNRLDTHLALKGLTDRGAPNLSTVKILRDPVGFRANSECSPESQILGWISVLAALKELEVPDCWRSDAVEEACEAKGVELIWTPAV